MFCLWRAVTMSVFAVLTVKLLSPNVTLIEAFYRHELTSNSNSRGGVSALAIRACAHLVTANHAAAAPAPAPAAPAAALHWFHSPPVPPQALHLAAPATLLRSQSPCLVGICEKVIKSIKAYTRTVLCGCSIFTMGYCTQRRTCCGPQIQELRLCLLAYRERSNGYPLTILHYRPRCQRSGGQ